MVQEFVVKEKTIEKKEKHSIKHSKDNALEENEKKEIFRVIKELNTAPEIQSKYEVLVHLMMNAGLRVSILQI